MAYLEVAVGSGSLGNLSSDGWGYVTTRLVVWPEASEHWHLQAVGWGQVLALRSQHSSNQQQCSCG